MPVELAPETPEAARVPPAAPLRRGTIPPPHKIRPVRLAQDGHSLGEEAVYRALWAEGKPETPDSRLVAIGYERLSALARLHWTNVKKNLRSLEAKLAIETVGAENSNERIGRSYRVWSYSAILERRRTAGLLWYRKGRGVELLSSPDGETHRVGDSRTLGVSLTQSASLKDPLSESHRDTLCESHTPLGTLSRNSLEESSSSVIAELRRFAPGVDDDVAVQLIDGCRERVPDASEEEIAYFIRAKASYSGIRDMLAFLRTAVPKAFEGESFRQFRAEARKRNEAEARRTVETAQAWLNDPEASEELKQWARGVLATPGKR